GEAVPTVASVPREGEAVAELRAAPAETAVPAEGQLTQSTEAYAATVEAPQAAETAVNPEPTLSPLRGLQIGLALTFVILLILTLLVRQRVR
ncbi:MAG: hypothetical protein KC423_14515, partial [Anaerolineales bacterium]|nr:hypothetical protein [Anaerolineales bacterium]